MTLARAILRSDAAFASVIVFGSLTLLGAAAAALGLILVAVLP